MLGDNETPETVSETTERLDEIIRHQIQLSAVYCTTSFFPGSLEVDGRVCLRDIAEAIEKEYRLERRNARQ